ncbi:thioredoxin F-type, chloroplastic-like [Juglans microcarpa x Juglans regia]|uniref:thioredoxin F-type, chloroplastic-like n=1 Tax=Juglans microcarpa x Juglans regia TaxID=2249226 RepID=UPI001B7D9D64|nr:thioredoxin F-type, chloroplastic-like [Juglans microcarpa x Juglans regia]
MALNLSLSSPPIRYHQPLTYSAKHPIALLCSSSTSFSTCSKSSLKKSRSYLSTVVRSSLETVGPTVKVGQVTEVDKDTFWPLVKAAGDKTVVLDMYTQWCGPCKVMAPKFQELSEKYLDVVFLKLDCNSDNKPLAKELGIRVVPTFKILKESKVVKEVTGAKFDDLVLAIDTIRSS